MGVVLVWVWMEILLFLNSFNIVNLVVDWDVLLLVFEGFVWFIGLLLIISFKGILLIVGVI